MEFSLHQTAKPAIITFTLYHVKHGFGTDSTSLFQFFHRTKQFPVADVSKSGNLADPQAVGMFTQDFQNLFFHLENLPSFTVSKVYHIFWNLSISFYKKGGGCGKTTNPQPPRKREGREKGESPLLFNTPALYSIYR